MEESSESSNSISAQPSGAPTPPSYSVVETKEGRLVNRRLRLHYPQRPQTGYHSLFEHKKRREIKERNMRQLAQMNAQLANKEAPQERYYLGGKTFAQLEKELAIEEVVLCHLIKIPIKLVIKLHLAYKDEKNRVNVFPITKMANGDWRVAADRSGASFDMLEKLINHYRIYRSIDVTKNTFSLFASPDGSDTTVFTHSCMN